MATKILSYFTYHFSPSTHSFSTIAQIAKNGFLSYKSGITPFYIASKTIGSYIFNTMLSWLKFQFGI